MTSERRLRIVLELTSTLSAEQYRAMFATIVAWDPRFAPRELSRRTDDDAPEKPEPWRDERWSEVAALAAGTEWRTWSLLGDDTAFVVARRVSTTRIVLVMPPIEPFDLLVDLIGRLPAATVPAFAMAFDQESKQDGPLGAQGLEELRDVPPVFYFHRERIATLESAEEVRELAGGIAVRVRPAFGKVSAEARKRSKALALALGLPRSFLGGAPAPRQITIEQEPVVNGSRGTLWGVHGDWVVGDAGMIARWNGKDWIAIAPFAEGDRPWLFGIGGIDELAWAVGEHGRVFAWDGAQWSEQPSATENELHRVHAVSRELVVAVGADSGALVEWNGTSWHRVPSGTDQSLMAVSSAHGDVWAAGEDGVIVRRIRGTWSAVDSPTDKNLNCISITPAGDVWVAGVGGIVFRRAGDTWSQVPNDVDEHVNAILARGADDVWIVANGCTIRHWDGTTWTTIHDGDREDLHGICALDEWDIWAVGDNNLVLRTRTT